MQHKTLVRCLLGIAALLFLTAAPDGGGIGWMFAFIFAFFVLTPGVLISRIVAANGTPVSERDVMVGMALLYAIVVVSLFVRALMAHRAENDDRCRLLVFKGVLLTALPIAGAMSMQGMARYWPA